MKTNLRMETNLPIGVADMGWATDSTIITNESLAVLSPVLLLHRTPLP
jgi:hypothetical protein